MGRAKVPYRVYPLRRTWTTKDGKVHKQVNWRIRYWSGDKLKTMPTGKKTKFEALAYCQELAKLGKFTMAPTFRDYCTGFYDDPANQKGLQPQSISGKKYALKAIIEELGDHSLTELDEDFLQEFLQGKIDSGKSIHTVRNYMKVLSPLCAEWIKKGIINTNPLTGVKLDGEEAKRAGFTVAELDAVLRGVWENEGHYWLTYLAIVSGLRIGECQALQVKHLHYSDKLHILLVEVCQSYKQAIRDISGVKTIAGIRYVPITGDVKHWLKEKSTLPGDTFIFSRDGTKRSIYKQQLINEEFWRVYENTLKVQKPDNKTFHSIRHTFNTRMLTLTNHREDLVKALMGHGQKSNMSLHYADSDPEKFLEITPLLNKLLDKPAHEFAEGGGEDFGTSADYVMLRLKRSQEKEVKE